MARLITSGFETGERLSEGEGLTVTGAPQVLAAAARSGGFGLRCSNQTINVRWPITGAVLRNYYARVYFRKAANPAAVHLFLVCSGPSGRIWYLQLQTNGTVKLGNNAGAVVFTSAALNNNQWYRLSVRFKVGLTTGTGELELLIDGVSVYSSATENVGTVAPNSFVVGRENNDGTTAVNLDYDDIALNDDQGADQNTWPGPARILLAKPINTNAAGNWTKPGGANTLLETSIDNTPPAGKADTTSGADAELQLRNPTAALSDLDIDVQSYSGIGVGPEDVINLTQAIANVASDSTTDTAGSLQNTSNPAGAANAFAAYDNGSVAGAFPTGWQTIRAPATIAPAVVLNTRPVVRLEKTTATTRVALVDLLGLLVEFADNPGIGQVTEADTAQPMTHAKRVILGQPVGAAAAQAFVSRKLAALGQTIGAAIALTIAAARRRAIGQPTSAATALPITARKAKTLDQAVETDAGQHTAAGKGYPVYTAIETDTAGHAGPRVRNLDSQSGTHSDG